MKLIVTVLLLAVCSVSSANNKSPEVVVSIKPIHSIVTSLMKDVGTPALLIKGSQTPYDFNITAAETAQLKNARLLVWVGPELEKNLEPIIEQLPLSTRVAELLANSRLKILPSRSDPSLRDPFFWMDDRNIIMLVDELTELLMQLDPARSHVYARNRREMLVPLQRIDKEYEYGYRGLKAGSGVTYFDTLQYFEQAYALDILDSVTGTPWDSESAVNMLNVRNRIQKNEAACLFVDASMHAGNLELIVRDQKINVGKLDVLGRNFSAGADLYLKMMQYNTDVIKQCLNADMDNAATARLAAANGQDNMPDGLRGRFILSDHHGQTFTEQDMYGKYALIFFGYTHCPDVCPTSLAVLTQALKRLAEQADKGQVDKYQADKKLADKIVPYFITVDPQRDTVKVINDYIKYFDKRMIGLTGSEQMIKRVVDQFKAKYQKEEIEKGQDPLLYNVDHTASLYLMAPDGSFITKFAHGISPDVLADELALKIR
jgi:ABC-type Zn2+ transport system substrate-binding protein/surface adhesin/cytochrome oxidase Cu insertion factor (SCO1/SenC/PrrC family)